MKYWSDLLYNIHKGSTKLQSSCFLGIEYIGKREKLTKDHRTHHPIKRIVPISVHCYTFLVLLKENKEARVCLVRHCCRLLFVFWHILRRHCLYHKRSIINSIFIPYAYIAIEMINYLFHSYIVYIYWCFQIDSSLL